MNSLSSDSADTRLIIVTVTAVTIQREYIYRNTNHKPALIYICIQDTNDNTYITILLLQIQK